MELIIVVMMIVLLVVAAVSLKVTQSGVPFPFQKKPALFTEAERAFMLKLENAVGDEFRIINRVRLSDLVGIKAGTSKRSEQIAKNKASAKMLDFVLLDRYTLAPIAAIDLVNTESKTGYKNKQDWFVKGSLDSVGLPHIRIQLKSGYKSSEIRDCLASKLPTQHLSPLRVKKVTPKGPTRPVRPISKLGSSLTEHISDQLDKSAVA